MHSYEVNIRICQSENSDVDLDKAEVNITIEGWLINNTLQQWIVKWWKRTLGNNELVSDE